MTPEYWQKIKTVLDEVVDLAPAERLSVLESACNGDAEFRRDVESFLVFDNDGDMENPAFSFVEHAEVMNGAAAYIGKQIGRYRIISELGSGGMGLVFLAGRADEAFEQKVALKLIKRGMDSEAVLQRFLNERRILASLAHPNIARLLDGGTTDDGVPYFVMEYVEGSPILEYAKRENLDADARLRLFGEVAAAVSYAHQNLIIHRDLKPSNILVTADGSPKLLDFGIAKLLTPGNGGVITATQQFVFTPDYASPEQVRGGQLTTATDIYSLGVVLYELLTGKPPYKIAGNNFGEIIRVVCEVEPIAPSRAAAVDPATAEALVPASRLRGDLDNVILKAIRKEPERRYHSVEQLSEDIRRHLASLPVSASSDSLPYRVTKFVRRHRYGVLTASLILIALLAGLGATLYQASIARAERAKAELRLNDVRRLANSFMFEINEKIGESPIKARELLVTRALEYLDKLEQEAGGDTDLEAELATAYEKVGQIQAELFNPSLGKSSDALASHQKSLQIREKLFAADQGNVDRGLAVIKSHLFVGDIYSMSGKISEARAEYDQAIAIGDQLMTIDPRNVAVRTDLSRSYARMGQNVLRSGSLSLALASYERSLQITRDLIADGADDLERQRTLGIIYNYIGYVKLEMLQFDQAAQYFGDELTIDNKILATDPGNAHFRESVSNDHMWLGLAMSGAGRLRESLVELRTSLSVEKAIYDADPANLGSQNSVADCDIELGKVLAKTADYAASLQSFDDADKNYQAVWKADPQNLSARRQIVLTHRHMADTITQKGDLKKGAALYLQALEDYGQLIKDDPDNTEWQDDLAICELRTGENLLKQKDIRAAATHFDAAAALLEKLVAESPENARLRRDLDQCKTYLDGGHKEST